MPSKTTATEQWWNEHTARFAGRNAGLLWLDAGPELVRHINGRISGSPDTDWISHTLQRHFNGRIPMERILSLGCGNGHLERRLAQEGAFLLCDAYDMAEGSLQTARTQANEAGLTGIRYEATDINQISLPPEAYDSVWIHSALHHFEALEHISSQIRQTLKPQGLLILNEYIGPSRLQFPSQQKRLINDALRLVPAQYRNLMQEQISIELGHTPWRMGIRWCVQRLADKVRDGDLTGLLRRRWRMIKARATGGSLDKRTVDFPSPRDVIAADPSEAIRSEEIMGVLLRDFDLVEKKDWGGNLLQSLLGGIAGNFSAEDPQSQAVLRMLIDLEDHHLQTGEFESDFAYMVLKPKRL